MLADSRNERKEGAMPATVITAKLPESLAARAGQVFPTLTQEQIRRIAAHGHAREVRQGEILVEAGDHLVPFFVVLRGHLEIVRPSGDTETVITVHGPGQ